MHHKLNEFCVILQRKDQNVVQAMYLVIDVQTHLMNLRNDDWEPLLHKDTKFCSESDIPIPNMNEVVSRFSKSRKGARDNIAQDYLSCRYLLYY